MATPFSANTNLLQLLTGQAPEGLNFAQQATPFDVAQARALGQEAQQSFQPLPAGDIPSYNPMTDPEGPLARAGWIGSLIASGGNTRSEVEAAKLGEGQRQAMHGIGARMEAGMTPQRAIMDFAGSPEGMQFFTNGGGYSDLANIVKGLTPAGPQYEKLGANESLVQINPDGTQSITMTAPNADVNKFTALSELGMLTRDEQAQAARAMLLKEQTGDLSAAEAAMDRLVLANRVSRETADLILSGSITPTPILDTAGNTVGYGVKDLTNNDVTMLPTTAGQAGELPKPGDSNFVPGITPGTQPDQLPDNGPAFQGMANPADIVDGAGPVGWLMEKLGALGGNISPALAASDTTQKRLMLNRIMADASQMASTGKVLAQELQDIRGLAATGGFWTNPLNATQTLISLHDAYDNAAAALLEQTQGSTGKVRGDAELELAAIRRAKANLPKREQLEAKMSQLESMETGQLLKEQATGAEKALEDSGLVAPDDAAQQPTQMTYDSTDALQKDWQAGKLTKGQTVILNGRPFKVNTDYKTKK